jgi:hypothetical protein
MLLVGADAKLAAAIGAHGLHLPERLAAPARGCGGRLDRHRRRPFAWRGAGRRRGRSRRGGRLAGVRQQQPLGGRPLGALRFRGPGAGGRKRRSMPWAGSRLDGAQAQAGSGAAGLAAVEALTR